MKKEENTNEAAQSNRDDGGSEREDTADGAVPPWPSDTASANTVVFRPRASNQDMSPSPKLLSPQRVQQNDGRSAMENEGSSTTLKSLQHSETVEIHSPNNNTATTSRPQTISPSAQQVANERLREQSKIIESLRKQIDGMFCCLEF